MFGVHLLLLAYAAFMLPIALASISDRFLTWIMDRMDLYAGYIAAAFTAGFVGVVIIVVQLICKFLQWLF